MILSAFSHKLLLAIFKRKIYENINNGLNSSFRTIKVLKDRIKGNVEIIEIYGKEFSHFNGMKNHFQKDNFSFSH